MPLVIWSSKSFTLPRRLYLHHQVSPIFTTGSPQLSLLTVYVSLSEPSGAEITRIPSCTLPSASGSFGFHPPRSLYDFPEPVSRIPVPACTSSAFIHEASPEPNSRLSSLPSGRLITANSPSTYLPKSQMPSSSNLRMPSIFTGLAPNTSTTLPEWTFPSRTSR